MTARILLTFLSLTFVFGCAPTDQHVMSFQQRLQSGKPIIYKKIGEQPAGCHNKLWSDARLSTDEIEDLMMAGVLFSIKSGIDNCYRIGDEISIQNADTRQTVEGPALVRVRQVTLVKIKGSLKDIEDQIKSTVSGQADGQHSDSKAQEYRRYYLEKSLNKLKSETEFSRRERDGSIQVSILTYVKDTAPNNVENEFRKKANEKFEASKDFFEETTSDKVLLSGCVKPWADMRVPKEVWELMKSGQIQTGWQIKPGAICPTQGAVLPVVDAQTKEKLGEIKIGIVREMTINRLNEEYLKVGNGKSFGEIKALIEEEVQRKPGSHVNIYEFTSLIEVAP